MPTTTDFELLCYNYLQEVKKLRANPAASPELSLRTALNIFLDGAAAHLGSAVCFINEGSGAPKGRPDFVLSHEGQPLGYVEAEKPEADLDHLTGHAKTQNDGFKKNLDNFLLTNHYDFVLYDKGVEIDRATLPEEAPTSEEVTKLKDLLDRLTHAEPPVINSPRDLAFYLARRAKQMRDAVRELFRDAHDEPEGELKDAYEAFKKVLLPDLRPYLSDEERRDSKRPHAFDDIYAQTLAYGLFAARFAHKSGPFTPESAAKYLSANPFLRQLFARFMSDLPQEIAWLADDMARVLAPHAAVEVVMNDFAKKDEADPLIHFYEPFLTQYDAALKDARGVYYTPPAVVSYITRSVHRLLQTRFDCPDGLADRDYLPPDVNGKKEHRVQILDPATGTGSFLYGVVETIHDHVEKVGGWASYAEEHLRPRLFGFELIVAPYVVAHLKLGLLLDSYKTPAAPNAGRWQVFLTNTLEPPTVHPQLPGSSYITQEVESANEVKDKRPILVVLGNPPYKGHSSNASVVELDTPEIIKDMVFREVTRNGKKVVKKIEYTKTIRHKTTYIGKLIEAYKRGVPGLDKPAQAKWLQDDYVKFIAYSEDRIKKTGEGIVAFVTNHGYLDNPTFRGMRRNLIETFSEIYLLNLHGNSKRRERTPDGGPDQNVFDIQQGVAIMLAVKIKNDDKPARVYYADLWGGRETKYQDLRESDVESTQWIAVEPVEPTYLFTPQDAIMCAEYQKYPSITEIFGENGDPAPGIVTTQDEFAISFTEKDMTGKVETLLKTANEAEARSKFRLCSQNQWNYDNAKLSLSDGKWKKEISPILYRPFDERYTVYNPHVAVHRRDRVMKHMLKREHVGLIACRSVEISDFEHVFCSKNIIGHHTASIKEVNFLFPLYLVSSDITQTQTGSLAFHDEERRPNFSPLFIKAMREKLGIAAEGLHGLPQGISAEEIFAYIYAVLHAPTYRARYAPFLRLDFPRVPLPQNAAQFFALAKLGAQLVALHTLDNKAAPVLNQSRHKFIEGEGNSVVKARVHHDENQKRVYINSAAYFEDVDSATWAFRVGGYTPAERWLKDRDGLVLTYDDQAHYRRLLIAQNETLLLLPEIDAALGFVTDEDSEINASPDL